jgi:endonuclease III-like uncharacterized protein
MDSKMKIYSLILFLGIILGIFLGQNITTWTLIKKPFIESYLKFDDTIKTEWNTDFKIVEINSRLDNNIQKAYFYKSKSNKLKPLIVSLHTWSGDYNQNEQLAELCKSRDLNYIHPDFRGANFTKDSCCSKLALSILTNQLLMQL